MHPIEMQYDTNGKVHRLTLDKDEMITLISLIYDGFEFNSSKAEGGDEIARAKHVADTAFVSKFKEVILSADVTSDERVSKKSAS